MDGHFYFLFLLSFLIQMITINMLHTSDHASNLHPNQVTRRPEPLTETEVLRILDDDHLTNWSWLDDKEPLRRDTIAIRHDPVARTWVVFRTTKRGATLYKETFTDKVAALTFFIERVRLISHCVAPEYPHMEDSDELYEILEPPHTLAYYG